MSEQRLNDLLLAWQEQYRQGRDVPAAQLCLDCPDLADELGKRVEVLRRMGAVARRTSAASCTATSSRTTWCCLPLAA